MLILTRIYNKEKTVMGRMKKVYQKEVYEELFDKVQKHGFKGVKGFFQGIVVTENSDGKMHLRVNICDILQCERW